MKTTTSKSIKMAYKNGLFFNSIKNIKITAHYRSHQMVANTHLMDV